MTAEAADAEAAAVAEIKKQPLVGLGFREPYRGDIFLNRDRIDVLEIIADRYLDAGPEKIAELVLLSEHFKLLPHSLDLSLGSAEGIDQGYLEKLAALIDLVKPEWFSDHLCFTRSGGVPIGHLAPVPYTDEALGVFVRNIERVRHRISTPLIVENIAYLMRFPSSEMSEAEFIRRLVLETGCGLLLDVTNLYVNSRNFGFDWRGFLDVIPLDSVVQIHFVGSRRIGKRFIDAHSDRTGDDVWEIYREVCERAPVRAAVLERDAELPPFADILEELGTARMFRAQKTNR